MLRPWQVWLAFAACVALSVAAVGWLSFNAREFSRAEARNRRNAAIEDPTRLALWRMDSDIGIRLMQESWRPDFEYSSILPSFVNSARPETARIVPSPLLTAKTPYVRVYFQFDSHGRLTSPQVPQGEQRELAISRWVDEKQIEKAEANLAQLGDMVTAESLLMALPLAKPGKGETPPTDQAQPQIGPDQPSPVLQQMTRGANEFQARFKYLMQDNVPGGPTTLAEVSMTSMRPLLWIDGGLVIARRVIRNREHLVQGYVLDWPTLKQRLEEIVHGDDLLPNARVLPIVSAADSEGGRRLASLPVKLEPGLVPLPVAEGWSPVMWALTTTWGFLLLATVAVAALLHGVVSLSERRAAFVSAVTHELRTPLTTFRMYAEMLSEGMVADEATRRRYLNTLRVEADRLTHLVENVLAYARLERNRPGGRVESIPVERLIERSKERLADRARQANFELVTHVDDEAYDTLALADPTAVEQILFNLVDNACKYAMFPTDNLLHVEASKRKGKVELRVRDHGPGIPDHERRRLFQPFRKSASEAARSAPGVGLGLALCRRMARDMKGDLRYEGDHSGACFVLTLPVADPGQTPQPEQKYAQIIQARAS